MSSYKNFDKAVEEADQAELAFKVAGKEYKVPGQLPAKVVLTQLRLANDLGEVGTKNIGEWLEALLGEEVYEDMLNRNVSWAILEELLMWLLQEYGVIPKEEVSDEEGSEGGEEEAPK
jgi:hypothetical protein